MTDMDNKVLVNVAPVAAADKVIIPEKIAEDVYQCYKAGASMVHLHVRDREGRLTPDMSLLEETLATIREERARWAKDIDTVYDILVAGTAKAVETTNETLAQVRKAMRIDYFTDRSIVKEWETLLRKANQ